MRSPTGSRRRSHSCSTPPTSTARSALFQGRERHYYEIDVERAQDLGGNRGDDRQPVAQAAMELRLDAAKWRRSRGMTRLLAALGAERGADPLCRRRGPRRPPRPAGQRRRPRDAARARRGDRAARKRRGSRPSRPGSSMAPSPRSATAIRSRSRPCDATSRPMAAARRSPSPTTGGRTRRGATSPSTPCPRTRDGRDVRLFRGARGPSSSATSGSSATRSSGSPRIICGSCVSSASTPASAPGEPDAPAVDACAQRANDLMALSRERIADELLKLLGMADPSSTVQVMLERGILKPVLPGNRRRAGGELRRADRGGAGGAASSLTRCGAWRPCCRAMRASPTDIAARLQAVEQGAKAAGVQRGCRDSAVPPERWPTRLGTECAVDRLLLAGQAERGRGHGRVASRRGCRSAAAHLIARGLPEGPDRRADLAAIERTLGRSRLSRPAMRSSGWSPRRCARAALRFLTAEGASARLRAGSPLALGNARARSAKSECSGRDSVSYRANNSAKCSSIVRTWLARTAAARCSSGPRSTKSIDRALERRPRWPRGNVAPAPAHAAGRPPRRDRERSAEFRSPGPRPRPCRRSPPRSRERGRRRWRAGARARRGRRGAASPQHVAKRSASSSSLRRAEPSPTRSRPTGACRAAAPAARITMSHRFSAEKRPTPMSRIAFGVEPERIQRRGAQFRRSQRRREERRLDAHPHRLRVRNAAVAKPLGEIDRSRTPRCRTAGRGRADASRTSRTSGRWSRSTRCRRASDRRRPPADPNA